MAKSQVWSGSAWVDLYTLPTATSSVLGGVKIGSNITVSSGVISLTKSNVTSALGYTPLQNHQDISGKLDKTGGTLTGTVTMTAGDFIARYVAVKDASHETTTTYGKILTLSSSGYIRYRTPAEIRSDIGAGTGTVTSVKVGTTSYSPSSGVVSLPAYPTKLPASDVYSWAKASTKPTYTKSEVGLGNVLNVASYSKTEVDNLLSGISGGGGSSTLTLVDKALCSSEGTTSLGIFDCINISLELGKTYLITGYSDNIGQYSIAIIHLYDSSNSITTIPWSSYNCDEAVPASIRVTTGGTVYIYNYEHELCFFYSDYLEFYELPYTLGS